MEKNLKSGKIVYPLDKTGCENVIKDIHKKVVEVVHAPQKKGKNFYKTLRRMALLRTMSNRLKHTLMKKILREITTLLTMMNSLASNPLTNKQLRVTSCTWHFVKNQIVTNWTTNLKKPKNTCALDFDKEKWRGSKWCRHTR